MRTFKATPFTRAHHRPLAAALLTLALVGTVIPTVQATGIPTLDVATGVILSNNALAQAQQAAAALKQAKEGIDQVREQYDNYRSLISGNDRLGDFLNNPALNRVLPMGDWAQVYSTAQDLASLRQRYGLTSSDAGVQAKFDRILNGMDALERVYDASSQRVQNAEALRQQLNVVQTPQQKQDLQLRYQQELIEQNNQQMRLASLQALQAQQEKIENTQRAQALRDYMMGKTEVRPHYDD